MAVDEAAWRWQIGVDPHCVPSEREGPSFSLTWNARTFNVCLASDLIRVRQFSEIDGSGLQNRHLPPRGGELLSVAKALQGRMELATEIVLCFSSPLCCQKPCLCRMAVGRRAK